MLQVNRTTLSLCIVVAGTHCVLLRAQSESQPVTTRPSAYTPTASQPASARADDLVPWLGHWAGPAELVGPGRTAQGFRMELQVQPLDVPGRYTWTVTYSDAQNRQVRPYELIVKDAAKGLYEVDEKNSIVLPMVLLGRAFYSEFSVGGADLTVVYRLEEPQTRDARIVLEIIAAEDEPTATGGVGDTPEVKTRLPKTVQRAVLRRAITASAPGLPADDGPPAAK